MKSYTENTNVFFHIIDNRVAIADFNHKKLYILSKDASLLWHAILTGPDIDLLYEEDRTSDDTKEKIKSFVELLLDKKVITNCRAMQKQSNIPKDNIYYPEDGAVFSIEYEDNF